ncbi:hypothetical protein SGLAU_32750 (plasmid) [Streptomyces glaucescens]|uniref:Uncharacterized protein n=1 Tax=Streptomyces glaucescens TaxID=1907 RepID=A0A089XKJ7_STRGA|nr:hypothetical protein SGLAU_32750 [Streptomyces glaucescens]
MRMSFRTGGPLIEGSWADGEVALRKFRAFVYARQCARVSITLEVDAGQEREPLRT